ncbi:hypothetical protein KC351_g2433 [Hortaea werneckii]|nr:hypothetical protein KC351_g2433 [Hortaea werneckii]
MPRFIAATYLYSPFAVSSTEGQVLLHNGSSQVNHNSSSGNGGEVSTSTTLMAPLKSGGTYIFTDDLPQGHKVDASTKTCSYSDDDCIDQCQIWNHCSRSWSSWSRYGVLWTTLQQTEAYPYTVYRSSYNLTSSTWTTIWSKEDPPVTETEVVPYALDSGTAITTITDARTLTLGKSVVVSSQAPPKCSYTPCTSAYCEICEVQGGTVELIYWADMATASLRHNASSTASAEPATALYKNTTLTSPTVYIDFKTAYATNNCGQTVGGTYPGAIVGVDPHSLYSVLGSRDYFVKSLDEGYGSSTFYKSTKFNFEDLSGLVPWGAYKEQPSCVANGCYTVFQDYHPVLALPSAVRHMDQAWASCGLDWRGAWDPPIALQPADALDPVTTPVTPKHTEPAAPQSKPSPPALETALSKATTSVGRPKPTELSGATDYRGQSSLDTDGIAVSDYPQPSVTSNQLQPTVTDQQPNGGTGAAIAAGQSQGNGDAPAPNLPEYNHPADSDTVLVVPSVATSKEHDSPTTSSSPANALEVMSEALKTLGRPSAVIFSSLKPLDESFVPDELVTMSSKITSASQVPAGSNGAQEEPVYRTNDPATAPANSITDSALMQPGTILSASGSQPMVLFSMDGSVHSASQNRGDGSQIDSRTFIPGGDPASTGDHVLSTTAGGSYEDTQFSLVTSIQTSDTVVSTSLEASVVAISEASNRGWIIDGHTLTEGGPAVVLGSHTISVGAEGLVQDGNTLSGPAPSSKSSISSEGSSPESRLPIVTTAHDANQPSSGNGQGESAGSHSHATLKTSSAAKRHAGRLLGLTFCSTIFSSIALPYV